MGAYSGTDVGTNMWQVTKITPKNLVVVLCNRERPGGVFYSQVPISRREKRDP